MLVAYGQYELTVTAAAVQSDCRTFPGLTAVRAANRLCGLFSPVRTGSEGSLWTRVDEEDVVKNFVIFAL